MKKAIIWIMAALLAMTSFGAFAENTAGLREISCPEGHFSTQVDFDCRTEYVEGDGLYFHLGEDNIPYVLVSVDAGANRVTDAKAALEDTAHRVSEKNEAYGPNSFTVHGDITVNGRSVPMLEMQYVSSQGYRIRFFALYEVLDGYTVYYRARCIEDNDLKLTLDALETIAKYICYEPQAAGSARQEPQAAGSAKKASQSIEITGIRQDGMLLGRCAAPAGWNVDGKAYVCTTGQSMENPWMLTITAASPDGPSMAYCSARNYLQILRWDGGSPHQEGVYNAVFHTPMLSYRNAAGYCDYLAGQLVHDGAQLTLVEENRFPEADSQLRQKENILYTKGNELAGLSNVRVDAVECSVCMRRYALDYYGVPSYVCVLAGVEAMQSTASVPGIYTDLAISTISWEVPFSYIAICPQDRWDEMADTFDQFVGNTTASDEFKAANEKLGNELISIVTGKPDLTSGTSRSEDTMRQETSSGDSYDSERFTDYLFDQNDYTLSNGSHVKVSTAYDYVYEGDNHNVYYSNDPFAQPGGSTQLYPNR